MISNFTYSTNESETETETELYAKKVDIFGKKILELKF